MMRQIRNLTEFRALAAKVNSGAVPKLDTSAKAWALLTLMQKRGMKVYVTAATMRQWYRIKTKEQAVADAVHHALVCKLRAAAKGGSTWRAADGTVVMQQGGAIEHDLVSTGTKSTATQRRSDGLVVPRSLTVATSRPLSSVIVSDVNGDPVRLNQPYAYVSGETADRGLFIHHRANVLAVV